MDHDKELFWRQYSSHVDLYKFYIDSLIKLNAFYYAITGALLTFYLTHLTHPAVRFSLIISILIGLGFALIFIRGAQLLEVTREEMFSIRDIWGFQSAPEFRVLSALLYVYGIILVIISIGLLIVILYGPVIFVNHNLLFTI